MPNNAELIQALLASQSNPKGGIQKAMAADYLKQGTKPVASPLEGAANMATTAMGAYMMKRLQDEQNQRQQAAMVGAQQPGAGLAGGFDNPGGQVAPPPPSPSIFQKGASAGFPGGGA